MNTPSNLTDRMCARVEFKRQLGTPAYDVDVQLAVNPDGIICVAGRRSLDGEYSSTGGWVAKYAADGTQLWFDDFASEGGSIRAVAVDGAGDCYTLGAASRPTTGGGEWRLRKHDATGAEAWSTTGPIEGLTPHQLMIDQLGNLVATFLTRPPDEPPKLHEVEVRKLAPDGSSLWSTTVGPKADWSTWLTLAGNEPVVVRSEVVSEQPTDPSPLSQSVSVTQLNADGAELSHVSYPRANVYNVAGLGVAPDASVVLGGRRVGPANQPIASVWSVDPGGNGTQVDLAAIYPKLFRVAADGAFWTFDDYGLDIRFVRWGSSGASSSQLRLPFNPFWEFPAFEPGPGYLLAAGTGELSDEPRFGGSDAFLIKLLVD